MEAFVMMSKYAGMREDLVQAGGGNSAFKISNDRMAIKASGYQLADVKADAGYAIVNPKIIREAFLNCKDIDGMTDDESKRILADAFIEGAKPSIETFLHSISGRYSLHTHPIVVNALACRKDGVGIIRELFTKALVVPYATPGVELAKEYFKEYKKYKTANDSDPEYVFLMNHGLMVSADSAESVIELTERAVSVIEEYLGVDYSYYHMTNAINALFPSGVTWLVTDRNAIDGLTKNKGLWKHNFCPDCVVFISRKMYDAKSLAKGEFDDFVSAYGYPVVLRYKDHLYIHADSVRKALEIQSVLSFSAQVSVLNSGMEFETLSEKEMDYLLNWDAEKYRKALK